jgi:hypothetical protein
MGSTSSSSSTSTAATSAAAAEADANRSSFAAHLHSLHEEFDEVLHKKKAKKTILV